MSDGNLNRVQTINATKRKVGCLIGLAKVASKQGKPANTQLDQAYKSAQTLLSSEFDESVRDEIAELVSLQFNILCALGLRAQCAGKVTEKLSQQVKDITTKMRTTNLGRAKLIKLSDEPEISSIYELIKPKKN